MEQVQVNKESKQVVNVPVVETRKGKELVYGSCLIDNKLFEVARFEFSKLWFVVRSLERKF